jgi:hypothetical protein
MPTSKTHEVRVPQTHEPKKARVSTRIMITENSDERNGRDGKAGKADDGLSPLQRKIREVESARAADPAAAPPDGTGGASTAGNDKASGKPAPKTYRDTFAALGVEFTALSGVEAVGTCPFCGEQPFHLNVTSGQYHCKHSCRDGKGNVTTFLTALHGRHLKATTARQYSLLGQKRGVAPQTLRRHGFAYAADLGCWLIPFKNDKGSVVNLMRYSPDRPKPNKLMLPGLPTCLYGYDRLKAAPGKEVFLCEGPLDAAALDYALGDKHRGRFVIVATPGAFKEEWAEHFRGRRVRALYDHDDGGRQHAARVQKLLGEGGVAAELLVLKWPDGTPDGYDVNDWVREHPKAKPLPFIRQHSYKVVPTPRLASEHGWRRKAAGPEAIDWVWPNRLRCASYCSFSGAQGTLKSTIARSLIALYTRGEQLPGCKKAGLPPGHVIYVTAEDSPETVWADLERRGADTNLVSVLPAVLKDGDPLNVLEHLEELRQAVREHGVRLVVIDGQNSVVGAPCIATDMLARHNVTNKLHQFAQREDVCLLGVRNEDRDGRAYGPASFGDIGRCVMRASLVGELGGRRYYKLEFVKVSDAAPSTHPPIPYSVKNRGGSARDILWDEVMPERDLKPEPVSPECAAAFRESLKARRKAKAEGPES